MRASSGQQQGGDGGGQWQEATTGLGEVKQQDGEKSWLPEVNDGGVRRRQEGAAMAWTRAGGRVLRACDDGGDAIVGDVLGPK